MISLPLISPTKCQRWVRPSSASYYLLLMILSDSQVLGMVALSLMVSPLYPRSPKCWPQWNEIMLPQTPTCWNWTPKPNVMFIPWHWIKRAEPGFIKPLLIVLLMALLLPHTEYGYHKTPGTSPLRFPLHPQAWHSYLKPHSTSLLRIHLTPK